MNSDSGHPSHIDVNGTINRKTLNGRWVHKRKVIDTVIHVPNFAQYPDPCFSSGGGLRWVANIDFDKILAITY